MTRIVLSIRRLGGGRNSSFELLRLISMWMILLYHFHLVLASRSSDFVLFKAIQLPLHIAVLNFILISGYFNIRFSINGISKLLSKIVFYAFLIFGVYCIIQLFKGNPSNINLKLLINNLFCISRTDLWFIRSYVLLYLFAPFLNQLLQQQNLRQRIFMICCLMMFSSYFGVIGTDNSLSDGKNLINFMLLYSIGYSMSQFKINERVSLKSSLSAYFILSVVIFSSYILTADTILGKLIWKFSFNYNSPLLIASALLFFLCFTKIKIQSSVINYLSLSVFAVYIIHENQFIKPIYYSAICYMQDFFSLPMLYVMLVILALLMLLGLIFIDKVFLPIQNALSKIISFCLSYLFELSTRLIKNDIA